MFKTICFQTSYPQKNKWSLDLSLRFCLYSLYFTFISDKALSFYLGNWNLAILTLFLSPAAFKAVVMFFALGSFFHALVFFSGPRFLSVRFLEETMLRDFFTPLHDPFFGLQTPFSVAEVSRNRHTCPFKTPNAELGGDVSTDLEDGLAGAGDLAEFVFQDMGFWADLSWVYVFARSALLLAPVFWLGKYVYHQQKDKVVWL